MLYDNLYYLSKHKIYIVLVHKIYNEIVLLEYHSIPHHCVHILLSCETIRYFKDTEAIIHRSGTSIAQ